MIDQARALVGACLGRVTGRPAGVEILGLPGERRRPMGRQPAIGGVEADTGGMEIGDGVGADMLVDTPASMIEVSIAPPCTPWRISASL